jgi:hypothetical protein
MSEKMRRRKLLKYSSVSIAGLAMPGTSSARESAKDESPRIKSAEVVNETEKHRFRKTVIDGDVRVSKFYKETGAVDVATLERPEAVNVTSSENGVSVQSETANIDTTAITYSPIIEKSIDYEFQIEDQCHLSQCNKLRSGFENEGGPSYDHRIGGTSFRLTELAGTIGNAVLAAALLDVFLARLPAFAVSWIAKKKSLEYAAGAAAAVLGAQIGGREFSFATYDYDLGNLGVYTPKVGAGVSNTWKGKKNSLVPLPETVLFGNDVHIASKCNGD